MPESMFLLSGVGPRNVLIVYLGSLVFKRVSLLGSLGTGEAVREHQLT